MQFFKWFNKSLQNISLPISYTDSVADIQYVAISNEWLIPTATGPYMCPAYLWLVVNIL